MERNLDCVSKAARWEIEKLERLNMRTKDPIKYVDSYEHKGYKLGDIVKTAIKFNGQRNSLSLDVKIIGFQLDTNSSRFIAVTVEGIVPKCLEKIWYDEAQKNRLVDVVLKGHENSRLMWLRTEDIK